MSCLTTLEAQFFSSLINGLAIGAIYALIALGLSMVFGILNLINFAHGEVFMMGSFAALGILSAFGLDSATGSGGFIILALALIGAAAASGLGAMLLEVIAYRPLRRANAPRYASMISGMGASIVLQESFALLFGRGNIPFPSTMPLATLFTIGNGRF